MKISDFGESYLFHFAISGYLRACSSHLHTCILKPAVGFSTKIYYFFGIFILFYLFCFLCTEGDKQIRIMPPRQACGLPKVTITSGARYLNIVALTRDVLTFKGPAPTPVMQMQSSKLQYIWQLAACPSSGCPASLGHEHPLDMNFITFYKETADLQLPMG